MSDSEDKKVVGLKRDPNTTLGSWLSAPSARTNKTPFSSSSEVPMTVIHEDICIKGELSFPSSLRIDGKFEGKLSSEGGRLHVGPKGVVICDLTLQSAVVEGKVEGNLTISNHLELLSSSEVKGDITAGTLKVEEGAILNGIVTVQK